MTKVGEWDRSTHGIEFEIAPYGTMTLGTGIGTIALVQCTSVAVQIVQDGSGTRLDLGSCIPLNGVSRSIRNPYGQTIKGVLLEDLPIVFNQPADVSDAHYASSHRFSSAWESDAIIDRKQGAIFMPKRGEVFITPLGTGFMNVSLIANAHPSYLDALPVGVLADELGFFNHDGNPNGNMLGRTGSYTDAEIGAWIAAVGWQNAPVPVSVLAPNTFFTLDENTAAICFYAENKNAEVTSRLYDLGDWNVGRDYQWARR